MPTSTRTLITAGALGLVLAVAGCGRSDQQAAPADTAAANRDAGDQVKADAAKLGAEVKASAKATGNDLKAISKDPEVKKAAKELKGSLKDLGKAVKDASKKAKAEGTDGPAKP